MRKPQKNKEKTLKLGVTKKKRIKTKKDKKIKRELINMKHENRNKIKKTNLFITT